MAQMELAYAAQAKIEVTDRELADRIGKDNPDQVEAGPATGRRASNAKTLRLRYTINYKNDSNYDYWYTRAKLEQTPDALAAREAMFNASRTFRAGRSVRRHASCTRKASPSGGKCSTSSRRRSRANRRPATT